MTLSSWKLKKSRSSSSYLGKYITPIASQEVKTEPYALAGLDNTASAAAVVSLK